MARNESQNIRRGHCSQCNGDSPASSLTPDHLDHSKRKPASRDEPDYVWLSAHSFMKHGALFLASGPLIRYAFPAFSKLTQSEQLDIIGRVVSTYHAIASTGMSFNLLRTNQDLYDDPFCGRVIPAKVAYSNTIGYMCWDLLVLLSNWKQTAASGSHKLNLQMSLHHLIAIGAFSLGIKTNGAAWFGILRLLSEGSTPFLNARSLLLTAGKENSMLYKANAGMILAMFCLVRIVPIPLYYRVVLARWYQCKFSYKVKALFILGGLGLDGLNVVWFRLILKAFMRAMGRGRPSNS